MAEPRRPPGGGGAGGEGLGRSRGGFTSKLHLSADGRCRPLSLIVTPGQRADCNQFKPVLEKIRVPRPGPGRPRKNPDSLAADKAYSNGPIRGYLRRRGIRHTIPEKTKPGRPLTQRLTRRTAARLRRAPLQGAQHRRAGDQPSETVPGRRHSLRQTRLCLKRSGSDSATSGWVRAPPNCRAGRRSASDWHPPSKRARRAARPAWSSSTNRSRGCTRRTSSTWWTRLTRCLTRAALSSWRNTTSLSPRPRTG
ncbi:transposase [Streptomyces sp. CL12-4]|nr:transposase [Streptomyces sp. CL12-4]